MFKIFVEESEGNSFSTMSIAYEGRIKINIHECKAKMWPRKYSWQKAKIMREMSS